ncbi:MAG TPA: metallopeptidase family protein [Bacteroidota bacterium]|nr:metallopeptidase family protein [Bacteroidota bacterium]
MTLTREEFEELAQEAFDNLPQEFQRHMDNVTIAVEEEPSRETLERMHLSSASSLLGLYEGIPLNQRGTWYGMSPVVPDRISLYKKNIERGARSREEIRRRIRDVLIHEIAHYYGMSEEEVRAAGY